MELDATACCDTQHLANAPPSPCVFSPLFRVHHRCQPEYFQNPPSSPDHPPPRHPGHSSRNDGYSRRHIPPIERRIRHSDDPPGLSSQARALSLLQPASQRRYTAVKARPSAVEFTPRTAEVTDGFERRARQRAWKPSEMARGGDA